MEHKTAVETGAALRYVAGGMDGGERKSFERHCQSCAICAGEVAEAAELQKTLTRSCKGSTRAEQKFGLRKRLSIRVKLLAFRLRTINIQVKTLMRVLFGKRK
jgi:hypothetical protein